MDTIIGLMLILTCYAGLAGVPLTWALPFFMAIGLVYWSYLELKAAVVARRARRHHRLRSFDDSVIAVTWMQTNQANLNTDVLPLWRLVRGIRHRVNQMPEPERRRFWHLINKTKEELVARLAAREISPQDTKKSCRTQEAPYALPFQIFSSGGMVSSSEPPPRLK